MPCLQEHFSEFLFGMRGENACNLFGKQGDGLFFWTPLKPNAQAGSPKNRYSKNYFYKSYLFCTEICIFVSIMKTEKLIVTVDVRKKKIFLQMLSLFDFVKVESISQLIQRFVKNAPQNVPLIEDDIMEEVYAVRYKK